MDPFQGINYDPKGPELRRLRKLLASGLKTLLVSTKPQGLRMVACGLRGSSHNLKVTAIKWKESATKRKHGIRPNI